MTGVLRAEPALPYAARNGSKGSALYQLVTTTDHKVIGKIYLVTSFGLFRLSTRKAWR